MGSTMSTPLPYTSDPMLLLCHELWLFAVCSLPTAATYYGIISVFWPMMPFKGKGLDEMYPWTLSNAWALTIHGILFAFQVAFIIAVPIVGIFGYVVSTPIFLGAVIGFIALNKLICNLCLNGSGETVFLDNGPKGIYAKDPTDEYNRFVPRNPVLACERWIFINGVSVGDHWLRSNLSRLASTFHRPILGIHNPTYGVPFDVLECIIQRTFSYATDDIRKAYTTIAKTLADDRVTKVVLLSHSQGCIETALVLDWLYATMPTIHVQKLEIYTFGNAANHWNCPTRLNSPAIRHIEHYANEFDWVARFGILNFRPWAVQAAIEGLANAMGGATQTTAQQARDAATQRSSTADLEAKLATPHRFAGRLFLRKAPGHMLNQHYLDYMFPMDASLQRVIDEPGTFMDLEIDDQAMLADNTIKPRAIGTTTGSKEKVQRHSRLWKYRNGGLPEERPARLLADMVQTPMDVVSNGLRQF